MSSLNDLMHAYYQNAETANEESSQVAYSGTISDPGAGATLVSIASLPAGYYRITLYTNLSGTTAGADRPNILFKTGATTFATLLSTLGGITDTHNYRLKLDSATTISLQTSVAGTVGSVYRASIVADRIA